MADETDPAQVAEFVFDPGWQIFDSDIDGTKICSVQFEHPRHGTLTFLMPLEEAEHMAQSLGEVAQTIKGARGKWTSSPGVGAPYTMPSSST
jgi:hypothetical protein